MREDEIQRAKSRATDNLLESGKDNPVNGRAKGISGIEVNKITEEVREDDNSNR